MAGPMTERKAARNWFVDAVGWPGGWERGAGLAEYSLLLLFIAIACIGVLGAVRATIVTMFQSAAAAF